tara:strand:+ start:435 stop:584 length:150 start_codon:yes stop_codon:yes gene_type:complete
MKAVFILIVIAVLSAPYCIDSSVTVGEIARDVKHTTGTIVDTVQERVNQ